MALDHADLEKIHAEAECIHDAAAVQAILDHLAGEISAAVAGSLPIILCVMNGGLVMTGHLLTRLTFPLETDYLQATVA